MFLWKKNLTISLKLECLQGVILCEQKCVGQCINPFELESHKKKWKRNNVGVIIGQRQLDQNLHEIQ
jgi:hypothetical protein